MLRALRLYWAYGEEFQCISVGLELLFGWFKTLFLKSLHTEGLAMLVKEWNVNVAKKEEIFIFRFLDQLKTTERNLIFVVAL